MMYGRPNHTLITTMERAEGASKSPELIASSDDTKKPSQEVILIYLQHEHLSTEVSRDTSRDMAGEVGRDPLLQRSLPSGGVTRTTKRGRSRASGCRKVKPYENSEQEREEKIFHDVIWRSAKHWFVLKLWREGCFFVKFDVEDATVDRCAIEAYEAAISEYRDNDHPDGAGLIAKYRLQPQATGALIKCRQVVSAVVAICGSSLF